MLCLLRSPRSADRRSVINSIARTETGTFSALCHRRRSGQGNRQCSRRRRCGRRQQDHNEHHANGRWRRRLAAAGAGPRDPPPSDPQARLFDLGYGRLHGSESPKGAAPAGGASAGNGRRKERRNYAAAAIRAAGPRRTDFMICDSPPLDFACPAAEAFLLCVCCALLDVAAHAVLHPMR